MSKNHSPTENTDIRACPDKRFCFFSAIKRSRKIRNERQKAHLFHTCKIFLPKIQRLRQKDFSGHHKFPLCSTTPPCAALAIALAPLSGICRTNRPICDFEGMRATGTPSSAVWTDHTSRLAIAKKNHRRITRQWQTNLKTIITKQRRKKLNRKY